ncbi:hypothetical protein G9H64_00620 [Aquirufa nivalisilvae]|jgi:hypothetical protein|uniref:hypothetical protein n=1 Tax=Aquirufa nivalisilvae TaxID=2516557 RepID=UPI000D69FF94|nr:hypothetical protein [Aquirufa nivalisilvae]MCZ2479455.1 hypothetical protein [Aquirufa nivalisilvae]MCZ2481443.1 hypothetical protein [Aquirufa nivalisilvae]
MLILLTTRIWALEVLILVKIDKMEINYNVNPDSDLIIRADQRLGKGNIFALGRQKRVVYL